MKRSDLLIILAAAALLIPCFLINNVNTALASSLSAANRVGEITLKLKVPSISDSANFARQKKSFREKER